MTDSPHDRRTIPTLRPGRVGLPLAQQPRRAAMPPRHLADLDLAGRRAAVAELGEPEFRAGQLSTHYFGRLVRDPAAMTDLPAASRDRLAADLLPHAADAGPRAGLRRRRHPQDAVAAARRRAGRERADGLPRPGHRLRLQPGRLRHGLPVLRHRPGRADPQPVHRRDRRPGRSGSPASPRAARSPARRRGCRTSSSWAWASRWPTTPRVIAARAPAHRTRRPRGWACPSGTSPCRRSGWCRRCAGSTDEDLPVTLALSLHAPDDDLRDELVPVNQRWKVAEVLDAAWRLRGAHGAAGLHRVRDDQRRERPAVASRPARAPAGRAAGARQSHPAQPDTGQPVGRQPEAGRARVRPAAARRGRLDDGARHPGPGDRRRVRPACRWRRGERR